MNKNLIIKVTKEFLGGFITLIDMMYPLWILLVTLALVPYMVEVQETHEDASERLVLSWIVLGIVLTLRKMYISTKRVQDNKDKKDK